MSEGTVFMFPGQGSQYVGMRTANDTSPCQDALYRRAEELLSLPLQRLVDEGPGKELTRTSNAQPALLVAGLAAALAAEATGLTPDIVLGHSLGEYTALVQAKVLDFDDAVRLVRTRGLLMERANQHAPGGMTAVIGAQMDTLRPAVEEVAEEIGVLEITNINGPRQVVVSGTEAALCRLEELLEERRLGRGIRLDVSAPFHCSLMSPVAREFSDALSSVQLNPPTCVFIDNVTGAPEEDPERIREKLVRQLTHPVLWSAGIEAAWAAGGRTFVECGPKAVLGGLVKRILRGATILSSEKL